MTGKLELKIINLFSKDTNLSFSINQIAKELKKAYPNINHKVNSLIEDKVLKKEIIGRTYLCTVNLKSDHAVLLMSLNEISKRDTYLKTVDDGEIFLAKIKEISKRFNIYTAFILEKKLYLVLDHIYDKEAIKKHYPLIRKQKPVFLDLSEFKDLDIKEPIILHSPANFYELRGAAR